MNSEHPRHNAPKSFSIINMATRGALAFAAMLAALALFCARSYSQMPLSTSVSAQREASGKTAKAAYRLRVTAGAQGATFGFEYRLPSWPGAGTIVGSPIRVNSVRLIGSGKIQESASKPLRQPMHSSSPACYRDRHSFISRAYWVDLPPNSDAMIELKASSSYPRWPSTKYAVSFSTFEANTQSAARKLLGVVNTSPLGARGTRIQMRMAVNSSGQSRLLGATKPVLRNARIRLRAVSDSGLISLSQWDDPAPYTEKLKSVTTDQNGRFSIPSKYLPNRLEGYTILARSEAKAGLVSDWNCGPYIG